tara:strand:+ start:28733 stop:29314 length:582 start_codon:yes stop_codon:yes gene_type:complete
MNKINDITFSKNYIKDIIKILNQEKHYHKKLSQLKRNISKLNKINKKVMFVGNGGSASTSSHASVDLTKNAKIKSINFNEANLITCFTNDYGAKNWVKEAINFYGDEGDMLIIFSCSGNSANLVNAAKFSLKKKIRLVTFTGKAKDNKIKKINKNGLNFFVPSKSYNQIEIIHHILILLLIDLCIGKKNYSVS